MAVIMFVTVMIVAVIGGDDAGGGRVDDDDDAPVAESQVRYFNVDGITYFIGHLFPI